MIASSQFWSDFVKPLTSLQCYVSLSIEENPKIFYSFFMITLKNGKQLGKYYVPPKVCFSGRRHNLYTLPTHIIKDLVVCTFVIFDLYRYYFFLVIEITKTLLRKAKILMSERRETPFGVATLKKKRSNVNTRSGFVRNRFKDFEHKQFRS